MKRLALSALILALVTAGALAAAGAGPSDQGGDPRYTIELDNAFGLIEGADVKVAGVRAGKIEKLRVDSKSYRALVDVSINKKGFGDLRKDAFCESRPQSLIGEYFVDCKPGEDSQKIPEGGTVPVEQTGSTIPADLLNNIMRRPFRERFSILIGELGATLAARGEDLNETIRRANPALRETDKVLAALAEQRKVIRDLTDNAENVVVALADNKEDVSRFIREARDTSAASAERYDGLREQFQQFPTFLRELRPTMRLLGQAADRQRPALATLSAQAPLITRFLDDLGPFSEASRPAFRSLAATAREGRKQIPVIIPRVKELNVFAALLPEVAKNLAITLEHLDDRSFAVNKDVRSPGGQGFTGLEAILQYVFRQSQATNVFDGNSYLLKVSAFLDNTCAQYASPEQSSQPERQYCRAVLGKSQPGIDDFKPTAKKKAAKKKKKRGADRDEQKSADEDPGDTAPAPAPSDERPILPDLIKPGPVQELLDGLVPNSKQPVNPNSMPLLDFLLGS